MEIRALGDRRDLGSVYVTIRVFFIHDDLLSPLECQCSGKHRIQINHHKKCYSGNSSWTILSWVYKKMMKTKGRDSTNMLFIPLKDLLRLLLFIYFHLAVWLWPINLTPLVSSFLTCKTEVIIVLTSNVSLRIKRNTACERLIQGLAKRVLVIIAAYAQALSSASSRLKKKNKLTLMWYDKYYKTHLM